ncbi:AAA family ATPase [Malacoplasma iowae]|uniref:AAA family ATPase n=1 Tax=Malacoplasma iowae 695 TaxID=1048830 RepID=A0A6P1LHQ9_MALIO|nr:AAA family ATPase [Malacoplasma iowae]VEU63339.1 ATPase ravA [Mycoplasmopsis fermentans]EGZ31339.1 putative two-component regulator [Malacoplasma iowae 695]QHG89635.2 AAA family ATPase [Malacoplasma iowae 695]WPL35582.1 AAA family ATPase [Malacoplasma iowae]VEU72060.1 ATPase ravA [Malacoplasma iowae]
MENNKNLSMNSELYEKVKQEAEWIRNAAKNVVNKIAADLVEREEILKLSFLCALAGESIFMLGPPGIAKSLVSRKVESIFKKASSFEVLMNRYSTPDEIFGPIDITELKQGKYVRKIDGYLPDCNIGFLDEIWKASSSIQNALLMIINEKIFINDGKPTRVPLALLIAASNELPERNKGLEALWDRFIIRVDMKPIQNEEKFIELFTNTANLLDKQNITDDEKFDLSLVQKIAKNAEYVEIPKNIRAFISLLRKKIVEFNKKELERNPEANDFDLIYVSDRKWKKIGNLLRVAAFINGRLYVDITDCFILENVIWNNPTQIPEIKKMINDCASSIEYGIDGRYSYAVESFNKIRETIIDNIAIHEVKTDVIIKSYRNKDDVYYYFMDADKNKFFFKKEDIDNIPKNENFEVMDWMLNYCTADEFKTSVAPSRKALLKYDGTNFYLYKDNDENGEKIKIYTNFEEKEVDHYRLIRPTVEFIKDIKNTATALINRINSDVKTLKTLRNKKFADMKASNLFVENKSLGFLQEAINNSILVLEDIVDKIKDMFVYVKLINYGFTTKDKQKILPALDLQ